MRCGPQVAGRLSAEHTAGTALTPGTAGQETGATLSNLDENLPIDDRSRAFKEHRVGVLACMAGPGTGKTTSLIARMKALIDRKVRLDAICYLTFIREIGNAFRKDYDKEFGSGADVELPRISTLHSFACRLLRNHGHRIGYEGELAFLNIADKEDARSKIFRNDLLAIARSKELNTVERLRRILGPIKSAWQKREDPTGLEEPVPTVLAKCLELLSAYRLFDWDQTVPLAHSLLDAMEEWPKWIKKIEHYLVDEYQDFNPSEQAFVTLLGKAAESVVIVGDDDQSLYRSRGGSPEGIRQLYDPAKCDCVSLVRCYRCKSVIVERANTFRRSMRTDSRPMMPSNEGGKVVCYSFKSSKAEIAYLRDVLAQSLAALPEKPRDRDGVVCLFPSWRALGFYFDKLKDDVECVRRSGSTDPARQHLEWILALVKRPKQRFLQRLLLDRYDIKPAVKRAVVRTILERNIAPADAVTVLIAAGEVPASSKTGADAFLALCHAAEAKDPGTIVAFVAETLGREVPEVAGIVGEVLKAMDDEDDADQAIQAACDQLLPETKEPTPNPHSVLFLTVHGAKGLTKKIVVMPGMEEAVLPGASEGDELDELKRVFYVALTRATDGVLMTYPRTRAAKGDPLAYERQGNGLPSPFVASAGIRHLLA